MAVGGQRHAPAALPQGKNPGTHWRQGGAHSGSGLGTIWNINYSNSINTNNLTPRQNKKNEFYIHGSVRRNSTLIRSDKMQHIQAFIYSKITLHASGVPRTHHHEYIKL